MNTEYLMPNRQLADMSIDELRAMKKAWFREAKTRGMFDLLRKIARTLGVSVDTRYQKYKWTTPEEAFMKVEVFYDEYGGYVTVHANGKEVASDHQCTELFVPGPWVKTVVEHSEQAKSTEEREAEERLSREHAALVALLQPEFGVGAPR